MEAEQERRLRLVRRVLQCAALLSALLLIAAGVYQALRPDDGLRTEGSGAALGLMLLNREQGIYVLAVTQDSPADRAGVLPGDYLLRADGEPLADSDQLDAMLREDADELTLLLRRDERELLLRLPTH